ncbi:MAG: methyltransferase domain-containing protein [Rhizobacter sp.]|nr:methyltransferase domain-containing protein [Bacteriovorax sp.]
MSENTILKGKSRDEIAKAYKSEPWWYDLRGFFILTFAYNSTLSSQIRFLGKNFGPKHLEVACGTGTLLQYILYWRSFKKLPQSNIIGIDYAESMLAGALYRFKNKKYINFIHADAAQLPFPDESFDTINVANSVHCLPDVAAALKDIHRVLRPHGTFAANVLLYPSGRGLLSYFATRINNWGIKKGILVTPYHRSHIRGLYEKSGFTIIEESVSGNCYNVLLTKFVH